jgi:hypothetical protein
MTFSVFASHIAMGRLIDRDPAGIDVRDLAGGFEGVEVEDHDPGALAGARRVQLSRVRVGEDVVESAGAADFRDLQDFIGAAGRLRRRNRNRQRRREGNRRNASHGELLRFSSPASRRTHA